MKQITAHEMAGDPELFSKVCEFGRSYLQWECMGYTPNGKRIKFARLVPGTTILDENGHWNVRQISKYVKPDTKLWIDD